MTYTTPPGTVTIPAAEWEAVKARAAAARASLDGVTDDELVRAIHAATSGAQSNDDDRDLAGLNDAEAAFIQQVSGGR